MDNVIDVASLFAFRFVPGYLYSFIYCRFEFVRFFSAVHLAHV